MLNFSRGLQPVARYSASCRVEVIGVDVGDEDDVGLRQAGERPAGAWHDTGPTGRSPPATAGPGQYGARTPDTRSTNRKSDPPLTQFAARGAAAKRPAIAAGSLNMVFRPTLLLAASAIALAACQQQPPEKLESLPQAADVNSGVATPRVSGPVGADARSQPAPEVSLGTSAAAAAPHLPPGTGSADVQLNFADTDIREIVRQVLGSILQVNYSIDPAVHGNATIETVKPLKRDELLPTLELLLNQNGASLVQSGSLYRVLPSATAVATPALANEHTTGSETVTLRYASAKDLAKVLEPFVAEGARITADPSRNVLLISGEPAARRTLPEAMRDGAEVEEEDGGAVAVKVPVPTVLPQLPVVKVGARSGLGDDGG